MRITTILAFVVLFSIISCERLDLKENVPDCIENKILEFSESSLCDQGASVYRYVFQNKFVYVFYPGNCGADMMATVYDQDCNAICGLGGFTGNVMCEGVRFDENATDEILICEY